MSDPDSSPPVCTLFAETEILLVSTLPSPVIILDQLQAAVFAAVSQTNGAHGSEDVGHWVASGGRARDWSELVQPLLPHHPHSMEIQTILFHFSGAFVLRFNVIEDFQDKDDYYCP